MMAVTGSDWSGADRSMAVAYRFVRVLKVVGEPGLTMAKLLDERGLGPVAVLI